MMGRSWSPKVFHACFFLVLSSAFLCGQSAEPDASKLGLPLTPTRSIKFTTDVGTWMSLDISPDGKTIVFDLLGHLYLLPITGGDARRITSGLEFDAQPRFSPDGKKIVFVSDRDGADNLWIADADGGNPQRITQEEQATFVSPRWTPDGAYVLASRKKPWYYGSSYELWLYDVKGGSGVAITQSKADANTLSDQWNNALGAVETRDGEFVFYAQHFGYFNDEAKLPSWRIMRRDLRTGTEDAVTNDPGGAFRPELSPDGSLLVYGTRHDTQTGLRVRNLSAGTDRWLIYPVQHDELEGGFASRDLLPGYAFLPDGKQVVLTYGGKFHRVDVATGDDHIIPFTAQIERELGPELNFPERIEEGPVKARTLQGAAESPDGKRLAFSALAHIYAMDLPAGEPHRLTKSILPEFQPAWSPDGRWIAYVTFQNHTGFLWRVRADSSAEPERLTKTSALYKDPVWSPEGSRIVVLREGKLPHEDAVNGIGVPEGMDLVWIPASGGDAHLIAPGKGEGHPHFAADSERIYVTTEPGGWENPKPELVSMRLDGTDRRTLLKLKGKDVWGRDNSHILQIEISPDGKRGLALYRGQVFVFDLPRAGGEPLALDISAPSFPVQRLTTSGADSFGWAEGGQAIIWRLGVSFFRLPLSDVVYEKGKTFTPKVTEVEVRTPRAMPQGTFVLRGARVITMRKDEVLENADVVVRGNRIQAIGKSGELTVPPGAKVFDTAGATILPGFVDTHAHWTEIHRDVLDMQNWDFLTNLAYGVTTGRDAQGFTDDLYAYQDLVEAGELTGPRAYSVAAGITWVVDFQSLDDALSIASRYKNFYKTKTVKSYLIGNRRQRQFMVQACRRLGLMPTTEGGADLKLDLTQIIDGFSGSEHQFPVFPLYKDVVQFVAKSGVFYTPTLIIGGYEGPGAENLFYATTEVHDDAKLRRFVPHNILDQKTRRLPWFRKDEYSFPQVAEAARDIVRAGGRVCVGGHGQLQGLGYHWALWSLQSGGMTNLEALRSATLFGAEALGLAQDLGSIEPGKLADLIVLNKNPLDDIRNTAAIRYVIKNGEVFDGETLAEIWPVTKQQPPAWWLNDEPVKRVTTPD